MLWSWWAISGLLWVWRNRRGPHLEGRQDRRLPLRFVLRQQCPCSVGAGESGLVLSEEGNSACLSSCSGSLSPLVELCVETAGVSGRCTGVSVPLRVVPSLTGWPSKRRPGIGFSSTADREIRVVQHGAPATTFLRSERLTYLPSKILSRFDLTGSGSKRKTSLILVLIC